MLDGTFGALRTRVRRSPRVARINGELRQELCRLTERSEGRINGLALLEQFDQIMRSTEGYIVPGEEGLQSLLGRLLRMERGDVPESVLDIRCEDGRAYVMIRLGQPLASEVRSRIFTRHAPGAPPAAPSPVERPQRQASSRSSRPSSPRFRPERVSPTSRRTLVAPDHALRRCDPSRPRAGRS